MYLRDVATNKPFLGKDNYTSYLHTKYQNTKFSGVGDTVIEQTSLDWADVLKDSLTDSDTQILGDYIMFRDLMDVEQVLSVLDESSKVNWYDLHKTEICHMREIAEIIKTEFESDAELVNYLQSNNMNHLLFYFDDLTEIHQEIQERFSELQDSESKFARLYLEHSNYLETELESFLWRTMFPGDGDYLVETVHPMQQHVDNDSKPATSVDEEYKIVSKVVDKEITADLVQLEYPMERTEYRVEPVSYDSTILELYPEHHIIANDTGFIKPLRERNLELYETNPLPL